MTEIEWQQQVIDLAHLFGWHHNHTRRTIGRGKTWTTATSRKGWPDLELWNTRVEGVGIVYLELKVPPNKPTPEQIATLDELRFAGARAAMVAYPDDFPELQRILDVRQHLSR